MKVTVYTLDGSHVSIADINQDSVLEMVDAFGNEDLRVMAFTLDDAQTYINKANIVRIDVD